MSLRVILAGIAGGIAMYAWSTIVHVATPLGEIGLSTLPQEQTTVAAITSTIDHAGLYIFPGTMTAKPGATGPAGLLIYRPNGPLTVTASNLAIEFVTELVEA